VGQHADCKECRDNTEDEAVDGETEAGSIPARNNEPKSCRQGEYGQHQSKRKQKNHPHSGIEAVAMCDAISIATLGRWSISVVIATELHHFITSTSDELRK
jgi:hypothetical protein